MWLFTRYGFYSVVCARKQDTKRHGPDPNTLMIRARVRKHLENLQAHFPVLRHKEILEIPKRDYRYRMIVPKPVWVEVAGQLTSEIAYDNFKACCEISSDIDAAYTAMLHKIWQLHYDLQQQHTPEGDAD